MYRRHRQRFENPLQVRFLTFGCYRGLPLLENDRIKQVFVDQLASTRLACRFGLIAWVLMPDHAHLLVLPDLPAHPVPKILKHLKMPVARRVLARWRELEAPILTRLTDVRGETHFWQRGGGYDRNMLPDGEISEKARYIHANPVRRGLVKSPPDWPWSSARWNWRREDRVGPPCDPMLVPGTYEQEA